MKEEEDVLVDSDTRGLVNPSRQSASTSASVWPKLCVWIRNKTKNKKWTFLSIVHVIHDVYVVNPSVRVGPQLSGVCDQRYRSMAVTRAEKETQVRGHTYHPTVQTGARQPQPLPGTQGSRRWAAGENPGYQYNTPGTHHQHIATATGRSNQHSQYCGSHPAPLSLHRRWRPGRQRSCEVLYSRFLSRLWISRINSTGTSSPS